MLAKALATGWPEEWGWLGAALKGHLECLAQPLVGPGPGMARVASFTKRVVRCSPGRG